VPVRLSQGLGPLRNTDLDKFPVAPLTGHAEAFNYLSGQPIRELKIGSSSGSCTSKPTTLAAMVPKPPGGALCTLCDVMRLRVVQLHFFQAHSREVVRHVAFRHYLRAHPEAARAYEKDKRCARTSTPIIPTPARTRRRLGARSGSQSSHLVCRVSSLRRRDLSASQRRCLVPPAGPRVPNQPPMVPAWRKAILSDGGRPR
jgi:hypothetical protein